ncbi:MAG: glycosyltransferase family 9 protein [Melioribacteraceae bacterium]|nr:glycosyltransferase family 9 protein [Melioribacteraceae bacterium]
MLLYRISNNRFLDAVIGKTVNAAMYLLRVLNRFIYSGKKYNNTLTIISLHKLGDSILTFPTVNYFIQNHQRPITLLCWDSTVTLYKFAFPNLEIDSVKKSEFLWGTRIASKNARKVLRSKSSETIIDITGSIVSVSLVSLTGYRKLIGFSNHYLKSIYDEWVTERSIPHLRDKYFDVVRLIDSTAEIDNFVLKKESTNFKGRILIHPFGGWAAKEWGTNNFIALAKRLKTNYEVKLIAENSESIKDERITKLKTLDDLFYEIREHDLLIGNDSGPIHLADMLGKFTIAIYGPTNPNYCKPYGENNFEIFGNAECRPTTENYCYLMGGLLCDDYKCMNQLSVDEVYNQICKIIEKINAS